MTRIKIMIKIIMITILLLQITFIIMVMMTFIMIFIITMSYKGEVYKAIIIMKGDRDNNNHIPIIW